MVDSQDYKYVIQDTGKLYVGAKYSLDEIAKEQEIPFKFRSIVMRHMMPEMDKSNTFESIFYYMQPDGYLYEMFLQLKTRIKVTRLTKVKGLFGKVSYEHKEAIYKLPELVALSPSEKKDLGMCIQEIQCSKLAIMTFSL